MPVYIGASGWQYRHWRADRFYPRGLKTVDELAFYAERFQVVEVNNTFYRLPQSGVFSKWAAGTPDDFIFVVKASRFLTHIKRLKDPEEPVDRFMQRAKHLGRKLGPVLLQLPPNFPCDVARLEAALAAFGKDVRLAVEFRHPSWFVDEVRATLERRNAALCIADRHSRLVTPGWRTADWGYIRFHEGSAMPHPCYGEAALESRADLLSRLFGRGVDVYAFFNNDPRGCAVRDAALFAGAVEREGLEPTRVPAPIAVEQA
jgi:uncharacterized protein YecE (DUF72 family)